MTYGEKLTAYRRNAGLTQQQIGDMLNVSAQAVSKWENDQSEPDINTLCRLAEIFEVSLNDLLGVENAGPITQNGQKKSEGLGTRLKNFFKKYKRVIIICAASAALIALIITALVACSIATEDERFVGKFEKLELEMSKDEALDALGKHHKYDETFVEGDDPEDQFWADFDASLYGYADAEYYYYYDSVGVENMEYEKEVNANPNLFDPDHEFPTFALIRIAVDKSGKLIEAFYDPAYEWVWIGGDYQDERTLTEISFLKDAPSPLDYNKELQVRLSFDDGTVYIGTVKVSALSPESYTVKHPWGSDDISIDSDGNVTCG